MRRKARIDRDSEDWNKVQQDFWFVFRLSFVSILEFVLHFSLSNSKVFELLQNDFNC